MIEQAARRRGRPRSIHWYGSLVAVALLVSVPIFIRLTSPGATSDILRHAELSESMVRNGAWVSYSIWYLLVQVMTFGTNDPVALHVASVALLSALVAVHAVLVFFFSRRALGAPALAWMIAAASTLVMPILNPAEPDDIFMGQISPNVWHNSTNILAAPVALVLFAAAVAFLRRPGYSSAFLLAMLALASVLTKPNYALALLPVLTVVGALVLWRQRVQWRRALAMAGIVLGPVLLLLALQYFLVFSESGVRRTSNAVRPFEVWAAHSVNIPLSLVLSLVGPLAVLVAIDAARRRSVAMVLAWTTVAVSIAQFALLAEVHADNSVSTHANWSWGAHLAMMVLFVVSLVEFVRTLREPAPGHPWRQRATWRRVAVVIAGAVMALHVVSGIAYLVQILAGNPPF